MKLTVLGATLAFLLCWASPALAGPGGCVAGPDADGDTILDCADNCINTHPNGLIMANPSQVDTDGDFCGNKCDGDFNNNGNTGFDDFGPFGANFGGFDLLYVLRDPTIGPVGFGDFGPFSQMFGFPAGPSGTTPGTLACP